MCLKHLPLPVFLIFFFPSLFFTFLFGFRFFFIHLKLFLIIRRVVFQYGKHFRSILFFKSFGIPEDTFAEYSLPYRNFQFCDRIDAAKTKFNLLICILFFFSHLQSAQNIIIIVAEPVILFHFFPIILYRPNQSKLSVSRVFHVFKFT